MSLDGNQIQLQLNEIKKKTHTLIVISFLTAFLYWNLVRSNLIGNEIQHGVGWPMFICPFLLFLLYRLADQKFSFTRYIAFAIAICFGVLLGSLSGVFEQRMNGIIIQSVTITFSSALAIIFLYKNKFIKVNDKFDEFFVFVVCVLSLSLLIDFVMSFIDLNWHSLYKGNSTSGIVLNCILLLLGYLVYIIELSIVDEKLNSEMVSKEQLWFYSIELLIDIAWIYFVVFFLLGRLRGRKK
ncbi:MAG: Bax inhibitor-1/YccA family protein [Bacteriovorax sp.]|nr:Bax inhibitor-1/YccA family protein [Bacteriovorax sp.]